MRRTSVSKTTRAVHKAGPCRLSPSATATPPRREWLDRRQKDKPLPQLGLLAPIDRQVPPKSPTHTGPRLTLRRLLTTWPARRVELGPADLAAGEQLLQRPSAVTPRSSAAIEAVRSRLRRQASDETDEEEAGMQEVVNSHSLATVDWVELQWLARVAMLNIEPVEATESAFDVGTGKVIEVPAAHQRIVLGVDSTRGVQVVSFRGTRDRKSFAINLDARLDQLEESVRASLGDDASEPAQSKPRVHRGYAKAVRLCLEALKPHLREDMPLMLTGHSMGGALAVVTALNLNDLGYTVRRVVTWGAPKVGKSECCASCASLDILRVSHADDLVVYLPPTRLTGYCHMGSGLILTSASAPCYAYLSPEERPCAVEALKKVVSVGSDRQLVHRAASHRMARYLESVDEYAAAALSQGVLGPPRQLSEKDLYRLEGGARRHRAAQRKQTTRGSPVPARTRWRPRRWVSKEALKRLSRNPRKLSNQETKAAAR